jgi:ATP-dependent Clp protease ATP-binding subunit ClpA
MDAANMLKPALVRADIRVIGATTAAEYERWIKGDPALERRFQPVLVGELSAEQTMEILRARRPRLEHHHAVAIEDDALHASLVLTDKFVTGRAQPDKAIDVLDEACAHAQATATLPAELERIVRERRKVDAAIRRRLARGERVEEGGTRTAPPEGGSRDGGGEPAEQDPLEAFAREVGPVLERLGAELDKIFGRSGSGVADAGPPRAAPGPETAAPAQRETLLQRRDRLDEELRRGLESLGIVVHGQDVARAVGVAVGKRIEWAG